MGDSLQSDYSWCKRIIDELDPSDEIIAKSGFDPSKESEWVQKIYVELGQQAMPAFCVRRPKGYTPQEVGRCLGQQCANFYALGEMIDTPTPEKIEQSVKVLEKYEANRNVPGVESFFKAVEPIGALLSGLMEYFPIFEKGLHNAFKAALDQPTREDAAEFFRGFAKGISKPGVSKRGLAGHTTATLIYEKLFVHRREVEQVENYPALKEFLIKNGVPESVVGTVRRLQKLCERVGLHLAKPGRPRKSRKLRHAS
jgi:hypothetical protein